jgi:hypothetical protein
LGIVSLCPSKGWRTGSLVLNAVVWTDAGPLGGAGATGSSLQYWGVSLRRVYILLEPQSFLVRVSCYKNQYLSLLSDSSLAAGSFLVGGVWSWHHSPQHDEVKSAQPDAEHTIQTFSLPNWELSWILFSF